MKMAAWLSQNIGIGPGTRKLRSIRSECTYNISKEACAMAMYSASMLHKESIRCLTLPQGHHQHICKYQK